VSLYAHHGDGLAIYPTLPADAYTLIVSDGAYGIGGFPGDPKSPRGLADWYRPHLEAWDRLAAPSSSLYFWGSPEGCARMLPVVEEYGWTLRNQITWDKGMAIWAARPGSTAGFRMFPPVKEDCYSFVRESVDISALAADVIYRDLDAKRRDSSAPVHMRAEREAAGATRRQVAHYFRSASGGLTGCVTNWEEGYNFPTWEIWQRFAAALQAISPRSAERPYLVTEAVWSRRGGLRESYEALREEYEALRYPFTLPQGVTDVWSAPPVSAKRRHSCAKRPEHIERIVKASSRPGDRVLEPFGGGAPVLRACQKLGRSCDSIERVEEWHKWALAILGDHSAVSEPGALSGQVAMF
jgi:hypothetical protein